MTDLPIYLYTTSEAPGPAATAARPMIERSSLIATLYVETDLPLDAAAIAARIAGASELRGRMSGEVRSLASIEVTNDTTGEAGSVHALRIGGQLSFAATIEINPGDALNWTAQPGEQPAFAAGRVYYADMVPCFTAQTLIETANGAKRAGDLRPGDLVRTMDHGYQEVLWAGLQRHGAEDMADAPALRPVRVSAGALGRGLPKRDLIVSPQQRVLASGDDVLEMFGTEEVLVSVKHLTGLPGIEVAADLTDVTYVQFALSRHEVVFAEGAPVESLFTGPATLTSLPPEARRELFAVFPDLLAQGPSRPNAAARQMIKGRAGRALAQRQADRGGWLMAGIADEQRHAVTASRN